VFSWKIDQKGGGNRLHVPDSRSRAGERDGNLCRCYALLVMARCLYIYIYICVCVCVYIYVCIYIYRYVKAQVRPRTHTHVYTRLLLGRYEAGTLIAQRNQRVFPHFLRDVCILIFYYFIEVYT